MASIDLRRPQKTLKKGVLARSFGLRTRVRRSRVAKRHILVDTLGLLLNVVVHPADVQDRDGEYQLLRRTLRLFPFIRRIYADGGYAGEKMALVAWRTGTWKLEIVKRGRFVSRVWPPSQIAPPSKSKLVPMADSPPLL